jgi:hypothetical protein
MDEAAIFITDYWWVLLIIGLVIGAGLYRVVKK